MKIIELNIKGKLVKIPTEKIAGQLWFHYNGETFSYEMPRKNKGRGGAGSTEPGKIRSPMPGKVIKVLVENGKLVTEGQVLIVMEAMKMEYSLAADVIGTVANLSVSEGQQVALGQLLVEIKES